MKILAYWKLLLALAVVALCSALLGAALAWRWQHQRFARLTPNRAGLEVYLDRLANDLHLDARQQQALRPILERSRAELRAATAQALLQAEQIGQRFDAQLRPLLTPEQTRQYEQHTERRRLLREKWLQGDRLLPKLREGRRDAGAAAPPAPAAAPRATAPAPAAPGATAPTATAPASPPPPVVPPAP